MSVGSITHPVSRLSRVVHAPVPAGIPRRGLAVGLPVAAAVVGTLAGLAAAALVRRLGGAQPAGLALAPEGVLIDFDKGGVRVAPPPTGIRPTFEVEAEMERELGREPGGGEEARPERSGSRPTD